MRNIVSIQRRPVKINLIFFLTYFLIFQKIEIENIKLKNHFFLPNKLLAKLAFFKSTGFFAFLPYLGPRRVNFYFSAYF